MKNICAFSLFEPKFSVNAFISVTFSVNASELPGTKKLNIPISKTPIIKLEPVISLDILSLSRNVL